MTVTHREDLSGRKVKLTIAVDKDTWQKALADAYFENHAFYPVEGFAPGTAPVRLWRPLTPPISCIRRLSTSPSPPR